MPGSSVSVSRSRSSGRDHAVGERAAAHPVEQRRPVRLAEQHDGEVEDLAGLDQRQRLEQLVGRAEAAGEDDRSPPPPSRTSSCARRSGRRRGRGRGTSFIPCSCGSSIPKPTESPPPSWQPRFAASITPGPPPVTTAQPASAKRRAVSRASSYGRDPSCDARRAEAGDGRPIDLLDRLEAGEELVADRLRASRGDARACGASGGVSRSCIALEHPAVTRREQAADERDREQHVENATCAACSGSGATASTGTSSS